MIGFIACSKCKSPLVITDKGLVYCPVCDPQSCAACPACRGAERPTTCRVCAGSNVSPYMAAPAAVVEHISYGWGIRDHGHGLKRDDSPHFRHSEADRAWRAGWARAEREAIRESIREKIATEQSFWTREEMRNAA